MKKNGKYLILPGIQAAGVGLAFFIYTANLPEEDKQMSVYMALALIVSVVLFTLLIRLSWILVSSYIINISKLLIYKLKNEDVISVCLWPIFIYKNKISIANVFWAYDDRTCFSMNKYVKDKKAFEELRKFIRKRNRVLAGIYLFCSVSIVLICSINQWFVVGWMILIGAIEHFHYQWEYKTIQAANAMSFAGLKYVDNRLLLHMLANQSKLENLNIGEEVAELLSKDMYSRDGGYFFNYFCLSGMFYECTATQSKEHKFVLRRYMDQKVSNITEASECAMGLVKYTDSDALLKNIDKKICLFYDNYREFLLYVLMYYKLKGEQVCYKRLKNYIEDMLAEVETKCINDSILSNYVLANKFDEYKNLFQMVLEGSFTPETSIFTGYDTLPVWKKQREKFISQYHIL